MVGIKGVGSIIERFGRNRPARHSRHSRQLLGLGCAGLAVLSATAVIIGSPESAKFVNLVNGHGWVVNQPSGAILLTNGETGQVDLGLKIQSASGHQIQVVQSGDRYEFVDRTNGQVGTIDLNSLSVSNEVPAGQPGDIDVEASADAVYVTHRAEGTVDARDPLTDQLLGSVHLGGPLSTGVIDDAGRLWVIEQASGDLASVVVSDGKIGSPLRRHVVAPGADADLTVVNGQPAVLDHTQDQFFLAPNGSPGTAVRIPGGSGQIASIAAALSGPSVPVAVSDPARLVLITGSQTATVPLANLGTDTLGPPVPFAGRVFLPDYSRGQVIVLASDGQPTGTTIPVTSRGSAFSLSVQNGALFAFDPDQSQAWTIDGSGVAHHVNETDSRTISNLKPPKLKPYHPPAVPKIPPAGPPPTTHGGSHGTGPHGATTSTSTTTVPVDTEPLPTVPPSPPSTPGDVEATAGNSSISLTWSPSTPHGTPVTGYTITWTAGGGGSVTAGAGATSVQISDGIQNGTVYTLLVAATSDVGSSGAAVSNPVTPTAAIPPAPTNVQAAANDDGSIDLSWSGDGNADQFTVFAADNTSGTNAVQVAQTTDPSTHLDSSDGIRVGDAYSFMVETTDQAGGTSPRSDPSNTVTANSAPLSVDQQQATIDGSGTATVTWSCDATCAAGSPLTQFTVSSSPGDEDTTVTAHSSSSSYSTTISGLTGGSGYQFTITPSNQCCGAGQPATTAATSFTAPSLSVAGAGSIPEGGPGQVTPMTFPVQLSAAQTSTVTVAYASQDGTATAGSDYTPVQGTLTFAPGDTQQSVAVDILGDNQPEADETLSVVLSDPIGAGIGAGSASGTIANDDGPLLVASAAATITAPKTDKEKWESIMVSEDCSEVTAGLPCIQAEAPGSNPQAWHWMIVSTDYAQTDFPTQFVASGTTNEEVQIEVSSNQGNGQTIQVTYDAQDGSLTSSSCLLSVTIDPYPPG